MPCGLAAAGVCAFAMAVLIAGAAQAEPPRGEAQRHPASDVEAEERLGPYEGFAAAPVFLPRSYLYWASPSGGREYRQPLVFGLEYAFHLPLYNGLRAAAARGRPWAGAVHLSFAGALRMLQSPSSPVRMPSYRPSVSGQVFRLHYGPLPVLWGLKLELFHHSNGQEGCLFDAAIVDDTRACAERFARVANPADELNRVSGSFANNAVSLGFDARAHRTDAQGLARAHLAAGVELAIHLPAQGGELGRELRSLYGAAQLHTRAEYQHAFDHTVLRGNVDLRHFFSDRTDVPSTAGWVTLVVRPTVLVGFGIFVRYYGGRDFYNGFFVDSIQQFSTGLAWDAERPLRFGGE